MAQDYSVENFLPEQPDSPAPPGRSQAPGAHEVADGGRRAIAQVGGSLRGGEERGSKMPGIAFHPAFLEDGAAIVARRLSSVPIAPESWPRATWSPVPSFGSSRSPAFPPHVAVRVPAKGRTGVPGRPEDAPRARLDVFDEQPKRGSPRTSAGIWDVWPIRPAVRSTASTSAPQRDRSIEKSLDPGSPSVGAIGAPRCDWRNASRARYLRGRSNCGPRCITLHFPQSRRADMTVV